MYVWACWQASMCCLHHTQIKLEYLAHQLSQLPSTNYHQLLGVPSTATAMLCFCTTDVKSYSVIPMSFAGNLSDRLCTLARMEAKELQMLAESAGEVLSLGHATSRAGAAAKIGSLGGGGPVGQETQPLAFPLVFKLDTLQQVGQLMCLRLED